MAAQFLDLYDFGNGFALDHPLKRADRRSQERTSLTQPVFSAHLTRTRVLAQQRRQCLHWRTGPG